MTSRLGSLLVAALFVAWLAATELSAQVPRPMAATGLTSPGTVDGMGAASVPLKATAIRMHVELQAQGKTLEDALKNLKDRREAALVQLEKLKADVKTAKFSPPTRSLDDAAKKRAMDQMVRARMRSRTKSAPGTAPAQPQMVSTVLTITWPLTAETPEQRLVALEVLRDKVTAANLTGAKAAEKLTPEEEELAEEAAMMESNNFGEEMPKPGTPQFVYVAPITAEQHQKALTEAFAKAKTQAERLAVAAGAKLGPLVALNGSSGGGNAMQQMAAMSPYGYRQQQYLQRLMGMPEDGEPEERPDEAVSPTAEALTFAATVTASFALQAAEK